MKCGEKTYPYWDRVAFPLGDDDLAFEAWRLSPCRCGYSPADCGVRRPPRQSEGGA